MKAVIFDMYGVIMKDPDGALMPFIQSHFPDMSAQIVYPIWRRAHMNEISSADFWRGLGFLEDPAGSEKQYLDTIAIDEEFITIAEQLKDRYTLALLSNDIAAWSHTVRERYGLNALFSQIVVSGDVNLRKPDPAIYRLTLDRLGLPASDCLFIDDRQRNVEAARQAGMNALLYGNDCRAQEDAEIIGMRRLYEHILEISF